MPARIPSRVKGIACLLLILVIHGRSVAQDKASSTFIGLEQGLPSLTVRAISHDGKGRLWAGTETGLFVSDTSAVAINHIRAAMAGKSIWALAFYDGKVLMGTRHDGLWIFDLSSGRLIRNTPGSRIDRIRRIKELPEGLFILAEEGTFVMRNDEPIPLPIDGLVPGDFIIDLFRWKGQVRGVVYFHGQVLTLKSDRFMDDGSFPSKKLFPNVNAYSIAADSERVVISSFGENARSMQILHADGRVDSISLLKGLGVTTILWQTEIVGDKIVVAAGDTWSNSKGALMVGNEKGFTRIAPACDYVHCFEVDARSRIIYYGTQNSGIGIKSVDREIDPLLKDGVGQDERNFLLNGDTLVHVARIDR